MCGKPSVLEWVHSRTRGSRQVSSIRNASGMWKGLNSQFQAHFLDINAVVQLEVIPSGFVGPGGTPDARMSSCSPCFGLAIHIRARAQSRGTLWRKTQRGRENSRKRWGERWREKIKTSSAGRERKLVPGLVTSGGGENDACPPQNPPRVAVSGCYDVCMLPFALLDWIQIQARALLSRVLSRQRTLVFYLRVITKVLPFTNTYLTRIYYTIPPFATFQ